MLKVEIAVIGVWITAAVPNFFTGGYAGTERKTRSGTADQTDGRSTKKLRHESGVIQSAQRRMVISRDDCDFCAPRSQF